MTDRSRGAPRGALLCLLLAAAAPAAAQPDPCADAAHLRLSAGRVGGYRESGDVTLDEVRAGFERRIAPTVSLAGDVGVLRADGTRDGAAVDATGVAAGAHLVWRPVCADGWSVQFSHGYGLVRTGDAFPPGGTRTNGILQFGVGVTAHLAPGLALDAGVRHFHVSNGKGLVEENPAFNGVGGYVTLRHRVGGRRVGTAAAPGPGADGAAPVRLLQVGVTTGLEAPSYTTGGGGGNDRTPFVGATARADAAVAGPVRLQVDGLAGAYGDEGRYLRGGLTLYARAPGGMLGLSYDRADFDVFTTDQLLLLAERHEGDAVTVAGAAGVERRNVDEDLFVAELFVRLYPHRNVMVASGVSWARADLKQTDADLLLRLEAQPARVLGERASLFVERRNRDVRVAAGVRLHPGPARDLRARHRTEGVSGIR